MYLLSQREQEYAKREIEFYENSSPGVISLAMLASPARKIEPELLRCLRLELSDHFPIEKKPNVGTEFALWFSTLIESRGADSITLLPGVSDLLRTQLKEKGNDLLDRIHKIILNCHQSVPPVIKWEEDLIYYSLISKGNDEYQDLIYNTVLQAAKAVQSGERRGLDEWISRMHLRIPQNLLQNQHFKKLLSISQQQFIKTIELQDEDTDSQFFGDVTLRIKKTGGQIEIGKYVENAGFEISVPNILPITITIQGNFKNNQKEVRIIPDEGTILIDYISSENPLTLQTVDNRIYKIPFEEDKLLRLIYEAKINQSKELELSSTYTGKKLTSKDLVDLMPKIKELKKITFLDLSRNELTDIDFLKELKNLTSLDLSYNFINDASFLR